MEKRWYESFLDASTEIVGGAVDVVGDYSSQWLGKKLGVDAQVAQTANPDEQRKYQTTAQNTDGTPIPTQTTQPAMTVNPLWLAGGAVVLLSVVLIATRGK